MTMQYSFRIFIIGMFCLTACSPTGSNIQQPTKVVFSGKLSPFPTRTLTPATDITATGSTEIPTPTPAPKKYTVKKDDFGWTIAANYNVTIAQLQVANPDVDLNFLTEGTVLIIPPPEATPSPILFTPTPVQLIQDDIHCYPAGERDMWCLTVLKNTLGENIYFPTGEFLFEEGGKIRSQPVSALLDAIPAARELPLIVYVKERPVYPFTTRFNLKTAVQAEQPPAIPIPVENLRIEVTANGLSASISGDINVGDTPYQIISVVSAAYGQGYAAGVRKVEIKEIDPVGGKIPFSMIVYTVGPKIERVEVFAEGK